MFKYFFICGIAMCLSIVKISQAESIDELKQKYFQNVMECLQQNPVSPNEIEQLKNKQMPESQSAKCLIACSFKKSSMMDDEGKFSVDGVKSITQSVFGDNAGAMEKALKFIDACKSVNDVEVSDGNAGCERAALMYKCCVEKAPEFSIAA